jgi:hypothetical protein
MKLWNLLFIGVGVFTLNACSNMPSECEESWKKVEKFGKQVGVSKEELKQRKKEFEVNISKMDREQAKLICSSQNSFLELAK